MILTLFWTFFKIGLFTIGGGYAMIPLIKTAVLNNSWLTMEEILDFIGIAESTPGPFAVNIATFIGNHTYGILGSLVSTLAIILPSFLIILIIARFFKNLQDKKGVKSAFLGIRPCVVALIASVAFSTAYTLLFKSTPFNFASFDYKSLIIMVTVFIISRVRKKIHPIILILVSAAMGIILYGFI